jgi:thiosulfate/3-mercaptopyruvate sulfurtransferase
MGMADYANPEALMTTEELAARLNGDELTVIEVDEDTAAYEKGHIPGAVALDWETELHALPRRDFVSGEDLAAMLAAKGASSDGTIVLYGGNNNWFAAYAYWLCKHRGIDNVKLLDGGRTKWELDGQPFTTETTSVTPGRLTRGPDRSELRAFRDDVIDVAHNGGMLVDVRSPAEFSGEVMAPPHLPQEQPYVAGHVPGASNIVWSRAANEDGTFKPADELRELYEGNAIVPDGQVIAYCRIGERSSHTWFVLSELLGYPDVKNYDGSWTEYGSLVGVPVVVGV